MTVTENTTNTQNVTHQSSFIIRTIREAKDACTEKVKHYNEKYGIKEKGKELLTETEKKARRITDSLIENSKKYKSKMPFIGNIEQKINDGLDTVRDHINLPSKNDIKRLTVAMNDLNERMQDLNRKYAA